MGCGTGRTLLEMKRRGIAVIGVEASSAAIRASGSPDLIVRHDLRQPLELNRRFDLVWCFEVAEHIHPDYVETALSGQRSRHGDSIGMADKARRRTLQRTTGILLARETCLTRISSA